MLHSTEIGIGFETTAVQLSYCEDYREQAMSESPFLGILMFRILTQFHCHFLEMRISNQFYQTSLFLFVLTPCSS